MWLKKYAHPKTKWCCMIKYKFSWIGPTTDFIVNGIIKTQWSLSIYVRSISHGSILKVLEIFKKCMFTRSFISEQTSQRRNTIPIVTSSFNFNPLKNVDYGYICLHCSHIEFTGVWCSYLFQNKQLNSNRLDWKAIKNFRLWMKLRSFKISFLSFTQVNKIRAR